MNFFNTFRGRLLLILAFLLVAILSVQFYLNLQNHKENNYRREMQEQSLVAGIALGVSGITSQSEYLQDLVSQPGQTFLDEHARERIKDIIIVNNEWQVTDSLNPAYLPTTDAGGIEIRKNLKDLTDLPPIMEANRLGDDIRFFPEPSIAFPASADTGRETPVGQTLDDEAHAVPIETSQGRWYVLVVLKNDKSEAAWQAAEPLIYTFGIFLASTFVTFLLVWRFTRPITDLSVAARRVAEGDLNVRVPGDDRTDEMGQLAARFNEMAAELEKSKELEDQLRQAEKSAVVGRLGSAIAHEIRNPLNYINLTLDHLRAKFPPPTDSDKAMFRKLIGQIKTEVARINQQISDFLNYSRPASIVLREVAARQLVENSLRIVEGQAEENNIKIAVIEHENVPPVLGDPEYLRSVFNNLFINAIQAMGNEGGNLTIKIDGDGTGNCVQFEIADTGNGIPAENLSKIFEPYFSTKETGTGLGLAIVQKIVDVHHGTIEVRSKEGEGTKFTVRLPKSDNG
jgi:signal transduction histidine kinase